MNRRKDKMEYHKTITLKDGRACTLRNGTITLKDGRACTLRNGTAEDGL